MVALIDIGRMLFIFWGRRDVQLHPYNSALALRVLHLFAGKVGEQGEVDIGAESNLSDEGSRLVWQAALPA